MADLLRAMCYAMSKDIDSCSHMPIWKNDQGTSEDAMVEEPESSSANVDAVTDIVSNLMLEEDLCKCRRMKTRMGGAL
jgi:hypothetical protein